MRARKKASTSGRDNCSNFGTVGRRKGHYKQVQVWEQPLGVLWIVVNKAERVEVSEHDLPLQRAISVGMSRRTVDMMEICSLAAEIVLLVTGAIGMVILKD